MLLRARMELVAVTVDVHGSAVRRCHHRILTATRS